MEEEEEEEEEEKERGGTHTLVLVLRATEQRNGTEMKLIVPNPEKWEEG